MQFQKGNEAERGETQAAAGEINVRYFIQELIRPERSASNGGEGAFGFGRHHNGPWSRSKQGRFIRDESAQPSLHHCACPCNINLHGGRLCRAAQTYVPIYSRCKPAFYSLIVIWVSTILFLSAKLNFYTYLNYDNVFLSATPKRNSPIT